MSSNLSGVKDDVGSKSIDEMNPTTKEEFVELTQLLVGKLSNYEVMVTPFLILSYIVIEGPVHIQPMSNFFAQICLIFGMLAIN